MTEQEANKIRKDILKASSNGVLDSVSKRDLGNYLAEVIKECSYAMKQSETGSAEWSWLASKKTLAESILIKFT